MSKNEKDFAVRQIKLAIIDINNAIGSLQEIEDGVGKETYDYEIQLLIDAKNSLSMDI
jgi:hypothetical protein